MLEGGEDPVYIGRRLIRTASEDVGLADPNALQQAVSALQACQAIGMPECSVVLGQVRRDIASCILLRCSILATHPGLTPA
jgi:replication-associated recombination protein RarA